VRASGFASRILPSTATQDARTLLTARGMRAFGDGFVSVLLPLHLTALGFSTVQVGIIATGTMLGSAALTLLVGLLAYRLNLRELLIRGSILTVLTGFGFAFVPDFWPLLLVAFVGTLNPSSGDVSVFLPTEQALLPRTVSDRERTDLFARYSMIGSSMACSCSTPSSGWEPSSSITDSRPVWNRKDRRKKLRYGNRAESSTVWRRCSVSIRSPAVSPSNR
jgi:MFS family permease